MIPPSVHKTLFDSLRANLQSNLNKVGEIGTPSNAWRCAELSHLNKVIDKQRIAIKWLLENKRK